MTDLPQRRSQDFSEKGTVVVVDVVVGRGAGGLSQCVTPGILTHCFINTHAVFYKKIIIFRTTIERRASYKTAAGIN